MERRAWKATTSSPASKFEELFMKRIAFAAAVTLAVTAWAQSIASATVPAYVAQAIAAKDRRDQAQVDLRRHPAELLAISGVKPGGSVAELIPGSGYFTRLFSKIVGPAGHVYAIWPEEYDKVSQPDSNNLRALAKTTGYGNITVFIQPAKAFSTPAPVDLVFTSQNYHDYPDKFMGALDPMVLNKAVFRSLKRGGLYMVVDHVAADGSGMRDTDTLHRIDLNTVRKQVMSAGFDYYGSTAVLRNPADDHTKAVFDPSVRGHTDQFVLVFRKPA
jgi:predicted methyltransferase